MDNDLISRKTILNYLKIEKIKLINGQKKKDSVVPIEARTGALLSIKAMMNFITQIKSE